MATSRGVKEGIQTQGIEEEIPYSLNTNPWGGSPSSVTVKAYTVSADGETYTDVTSTVMPTGSASVSGDVVTLPKLKSLISGTLYRIEVKFTSAGNVLEANFYVKAER